MQVWMPILLREILLFSASRSLVERSKFRQFLFESKISEFFMLLKSLGLDVFHLRVPVGVAIDGSVDGFVWWARLVPQSVAFRFISLRARLQYSSGLISFCTRSGCTWWNTLRFRFTTDSLIFLNHFVSRQYKNIWTKVRISKIQICKVSSSSRTFVSLSYFQISWNKLLIFEEAELGLFTIGRFSLFHD